MLAGIHLAHSRLLVRQITRAGMIRRIHNLAALLHVTQIAYAFSSSFRILRIVRL